MNLEKLSERVKAVLCLMSCVVKGNSLDLASDLFSYFKNLTSNLILEFRRCDFFSFS